MQSVMVSYDLYPWRPAQAPAPAPRRGGVLVPKHNVPPYLAGFLRDSIARAAAVANPCELCVDWGVTSSAGRDPLVELREDGFWVVPTSVVAERVIHDRPNARPLPQPLRVVLPAVASECPFASALCSTEAATFYVNANGFPELRPVVALEEMPDGTRCYREPARALIDVDEYKAIRTTETARAQELLKMSKAVGRLFALKGDRVHMATATFVSPSIVMTTKRELFLTDPQSLHLFTPDVYMPPESVLVHERHRFLYRCKLLFASPDPEARGPSEGDHSSSDTCPADCAFFEIVGLRSPLFYVPKAHEHIVLNDEAAQSGPLAYLLSYHAKPKDDAIIEMLKPLITQLTVAGASQVEAIVIATSTLELAYAKYDRLSLAPGRLVHVSSNWVLHTIPSSNSASGALIVSEGGVSSVCPLFCGYLKGAWLEDKGTLQAKNCAVSVEHPVFKSAYTSIVVPSIKPEDLPEAVVDAIYSFCG